MFPPVEKTQFSSVQSLSRVQLFATPWTAGREASLPITNSQSLLKLISIALVIPSNHLILCCVLLPPSIFPSIRDFSMSQFFASCGQRIGVSASALVLKMSNWDGSPLGWSAWISLQSKGLSRVFLQHHSSKALVLQHSAFFIVQFSHPYMTTGKTWLMHAGSSIFAAACRIFSCGMCDLVPWSGIEPVPPTLWAWSVSHWTTREVA